MAYDTTPYKGGHPSHRWALDNEGATYCLDCEIFPYDEEARERVCGAVKLIDIDLYPDTHTVVRYYSNGRDYSETVDEAEFRLLEALTEDEAETEEAPSVWPEDPAERKAAKEARLKEMMDQGLIPTEPPTGRLSGRHPSDQAEFLKTAGQHWKEIFGE